MCYFYCECFHSLYSSIKLNLTCRHGCQAAVEQFHGQFSDGCRGQGILTRWGGKKKVTTFITKDKARGNTSTLLTKEKKKVASYVQCCWPWCPWRSARLTSWIPPLRESAPEAQSWPADQLEMEPERTHERWDIIKHNTGNDLLNSR